MGFKTATRYRLADATAYDDEYGEGYRFAETYGHITCDNMTIVDCWITDEFGNVHPGLDASPVPVRFCDLVPESAEPGLVTSRTRTAALWA